MAAPREKQSRQISLAALVTISSPEHAHHIRARKLIPK